MTIKEFFIEQGWAIGFAEVRRYISAGAVLINSVPVRSADAQLTNGDVISFSRKQVTFNGEAMPTP